MNDKRTRTFIPWVKEKLCHESKRLTRNASQFTSNDLCSRLHCRLQCLHRFVPQIAQTSITSPSVLSLVALVSVKLVDKPSPEGVLIIKPMDTQYQYNGQV